MRDDDARESIDTCSLTQIGNEKKNNQKRNKFNNHGIYDIFSNDNNSRTGCFHFGTLILIKSIVMHNKRSFHILVIYLMMSMNSYFNHFIYKKPFVFIVFVNGNGRHGNGKTTYT